MKTTAIACIVIAVLGVGVAFFTGTRVEQERVDIVKGECENPEKRLNRVYLPRLGLDAYLADLRWVWLIQQMGRQSSGRLDERSAKYFADALDSLTTINPDLNEAYVNGAMFFNDVAPMRAIDIFDRGTELALDPYWKWKELAAVTAEHFLTRKIEDKEEAKELAKQYYREAAKTGKAPDHIVRGWMRLSLRHELANTEDEIQELQAKRQFVVDLKEEMMPAEEEVIEEGGEGMPETDEYLEYTGDGGSAFSGHGYFETLRQEVMSEAKRYVDAEVKRINREEEGIDIAALQEKVGQARSIYKELRMLGVIESAHMCDRCLTSFGPGEFFCNNCGAEVAAFNYCHHCWETERRLVILEPGEYCHICGTQHPRRGHGHKSSHHDVHEEHKQ
jgi:hypothetical protein